jgi:hypothetical protein
MTSLEMLMQWKHNRIYGKDRHAHTEQVLAAYRRNRGYTIESLADEYGLKRVTNLGGGIASWRKALGESPILLTGRYGMARLGIGGHVILAIGISGSGKIVYMDPFRTGWNRKKYIYMTVEEAHGRLFFQYGLPDAWTTE